ncbi:hypothetical protein C8F04DRAFT_1129779 [Mycena alexandri]|uniref:Uncharacterized protein n=1 Tax=Mycena alexandri TaxID=1745969 RepID=A0AAD6SCT4_9AGAR|nr:hypothetical protein C8F04DRAFT_1129779 [Mycena alexandri]
MAAERNRGKQWRVVPWVSLTSVWQLFSGNFLAGPRFPVSIEQSLISESNLRSTLLVHLFLFYALFPCLLTILP